MPIDEVMKFKKDYAKFLKWLSYMRDKREKADPESKSWKDLMVKFNIQVVEPMDSAWIQLTNEEKKPFQIKKMTDSLTTSKREMF